MMQHELACDLLVAGGGPAGVSCALAAARLGARVILCQDRPVLGGNASSEVRMHIVGATGLDAGVALETELREGGIVEELRLDLAVHNAQRSPSMFDLLLYDKCRREPNLTLLLNTTVDGAEVAGGSIQFVMATRASTEDRFRIRAALFADCTGDGRLGVEAGAPFRHGREGREEYGETLAPLVADHRTLGSTILFQARRHAQPMPFVAPPWIRKFKDEDFRLRPFGRAGSDLGLEYGYWWAEWGGCLDTIKDNERIRDELLAIVLGIWDHVKNRSKVDASHWALEWFGFLPGKRESRRFVGLHVLTEEDLFSSRVFPDAIAFGGWPIDTHPPEGVDAPDLAPCEQHHLPFLYDIPLRSCLSAGVRNLVFAGRNLSATHIAFASTRVMATCSAVGQGLGTAAALALRDRRTLAEAAEDAAFLHRVQQRLLRDDCYLIGVANEDRDDLVRAASAVTASSHQPGGEPELIRSGQTRAIHGRPSARVMHNLWDDVLRDAAPSSFPATPDGGSGIAEGDAAKPDSGTASAEGVAALRRVSDPRQVAPGSARHAHDSGAPPVSSDRPAPSATTIAATCAPPDRARPGLHRWMSDPAAGLPAWIEVRWASVVVIGEIQLIFDTGLHRHLTLSQADGYTKKMQWGRPQFETVSDYVIEVQTNGAWTEVARERGNYQRRRVHTIPAARAVTALRVRVDATHGLDHARILELRAYR
jgi:hypothetical protein